jgi:ferric-dicitrate binding protein FerR (iron transport regulator)
MKQENEHIDISIVLLRYINNEATDEDMLIIREWLDEDPSHITYLQELRLGNELTKSALQNKDFNTNKAYSKFQQKISGNSQKTILKRIYISAASVAALLILFLGIYSILKTNSPVPEKIQYTAQEDSISKIILPDSSSVFLNSGSTLTYDNTFNNDIRKIALSGEAFFSVQPDSTKPFLVNIENVNIRVLGTSFSVSHDTIAKEILVTVKTGKVTINYLDTSLLLKKTEQATVNIMQETISKQPLKTNNSDAWVTGILKFENAPLIQVIESINKHFKYNISIASGELKQKNVYATFNKKDGVELILRTLALGLSAQYEKNNGEYVLYDKTHNKE